MRFIVPIQDYFSTAVRRNLQHMVEYRNLTGDASQEQRRFKIEAHRRVARYYSVSSRYLGGPYEKDGDDGQGEAYGAMMGQQRP